uniref:Uncharacterized protein n=1 Tax=Mus spicilegus TaxID=10103 RepID=A0A8C6GHZ3_MUSSI
LRSYTPGAPPMSLPSRPGLTGRGGEGRPHRQKRDHPRAAALRWLKFLSQTLRERKRYWLTASCPWVSFASSQLRAPRLRPRGANQNRKGMRPLLGCCWPAWVGRWFPAAGRIGGTGEGISRGRCPPRYLGTPAPQAAPCGRAAAHPTRPCLTSRRAALTATPWVGPSPGRVLQRVIKGPGEKAGPWRPSPAWWPIRMRVGGPDGVLQRPRRDSRGRPRAAQREGCGTARFPGCTRAGGASGHRRIPATGCPRVEAVAEGLPPFCPRVFKAGCRETEMMVWDWSPAHPCGPNAKLIEALSPLCDEGKHRWSSGVTCLSHGQLSKPVSKL